MKNKWSNKIIKNIFRAKEIFHKEMAGISFEKKIEILIYLQKINKDIRKAPKDKFPVWQI